MDGDSRVEESRYFGRIGVPKIYAYTTPHYSDTPWTGSREGTGLLKVGYTEKEVVDRIWQQFPTATPEKQPFTILLEDQAVTDDRGFFRDGSVHKLLEKKGVRRVNGEWFECTVEDVKEALIEIKTGQRTTTSGRHQDFDMRPEQRAAVSATARYFRAQSESKNGAGDRRASHFLWNAKMRFGKTFTSYQLAKEMGWKRVLVLTYKPAVADAWREDLESHVDFDGWQFLSRDENYEDMDDNRPIVWFASFQDILGRTADGKIKPRFEAAHLIDWDCVILDEYHFGAWRDAAKDLYDADLAESDLESDAAKKDEDAAQAFSEETFPLSVAHFLYLSGTPFRALGSGEFLEDQIYNWTYADEQRAKEAWDENKRGPNPYAELPQMVLMTYQMPDAIREVALKGEQNEFDLNEFFRAEKVPAEEAEDGIETYRFIHENAVQDWLHLIRGKYMPANLVAGEDHVKPPVPFEDVRLQRHLTHTFWFMPSVASCRAMKLLLGQEQNVFFHDYRVIVAAGSDAGMGLEAIKPVRDAIGKGVDTKTITLSCGKLTTGVSVAPWSGIFMLRSTSSPESYFQAAFRVQTPWSLTNRDGLDPKRKEILKHKCYIFDFAPSRALNLIAEYNSRIDIGSTEASVEKKVSDFIHFLPVLCYDGFHMHPLNAEQLLDYAVSGIASTMLAKRWQSARMVNVDNDALERILNNATLLASLERIEAFRSLGKDLTKVISSEKALNQVKKEKGKLDTKETKDEDKKNRGFKKELREKLLKFVTRVPVFMYLTDHREATLVDVIQNIEPQLFTRVTGLQVKDFRTLCEIGVFNSQVMNAAIFAFKRFEEASLIYAGGQDLPERVGGFDAIIGRTELHEVTETIS
ncbi:T5orf172 domain-containing protein [Palleronia salina]|uniref:T5orf172 domain-containing protein n=1 Tax=Palleronia salina TaxID=313368 RepID=A0A1M6GRJ9_9RHOB|nr:GIY-YIG nuclease family protein [Palleronia salina]SHJ12539.1 T5orf172 domain-containing protein [Palleronia salina]